MEDMSGMWENFHLNDREEVPFEFGPEEEIEQFYLAARFMTSRVLNIESVVRTFKPLWRAAHGFTARDMGNNMLVFAFEDVSDLERVLQSEPWSYDKHLVSFQRVEADTSISEMDCQWVSFWVQIHNLPVRRMNHETASALGGTLGMVEKVVESEEERGREGCMRVRVKVDISKPLCRGRKARLFAGKETWISFKYERLPNFCYWCGLLTHGDRDCEKWLRSKGTLRREDQQYGAWLRASVERPIRRVEVKVIGRSDVPRWGKSHQKNEDHGGQTSTHGGNGSPKVVKPFMDFTQLKENLPNPLGDDAATVVNVEQILPTNSAASILSTDPSTAVNVEQILSTNSAASMQYSDPNTAVNVKKTLPKESTASIPSFDPSIAANHVEKAVHSCAKSPPDFLQQNAVHSCVKSSPDFPQQNDVGKKGDNKINQSGILRDISGSIRKGKESQLRKKKSLGGPKNLPNGKKNILKNTCGVQSSPNGQEKNSTNTCDLSGLHEVKIQTEPSGLHEVKIQTEPRGSWKRVLRDKDLSQESVECSQFFEGNQIQKLSGVKRSGALSNGDSNYSGWQKKVRGNEGNQSTTLDGDEAEAVVQPRRTQ